MAVADDDHEKDSGLDLIDRSYLTFIVPCETGLDLDEVFKQSGEPVPSVLARTEQRDWLFFDETVDVFLILRTPYQAEKAFRFFLGRLAISLEAHVVNSHAPDRGSPPASEAIYEGAVEDTTDPFVVFDEQSRNDEDDETGGGRNVYVIWKLPVFLTRPRIRLQGPSAIFSASASVRAANGGDHSAPRTGYLESKVPAGLNLLQAFSNDPSLGGIEPRLSAMRVSRVAPVTPFKTQTRPVKALHSLSFKIFPVVHTRVRFARPNTTPSSPALVALLEVDFTPFFDCEVVLRSINLKVTHGTVQDLNGPAGITLPMSCVAHDHVTFLYRLAPEDVDLDSKVTATTRDLEINIEVSALVKPGVCTPELKMAWTTALDFTLPLNPGFGTAGLIQPIQRSHRPSQLSIGGTDAQSLTAPSVSRPDALPSLEAATIRSAETAIPDFGITMTLTGPEAPVYVGDEFRWTVFVVNRSPAATVPPSSATTTIGTGTAAQQAPTPARKLALLAIPKRRRNELRVLRPPSSTPATGGPRDNHRHTTADAVLDENVVHAVQRSSLVDSTEVVCLSADVRVGPLAPAACAVVDLRFLALQEGVVGVECVRVVDLGSQEHVDVRELPTVVVRRRR